jgi:transcription elongation factor Elf1
MQFKHLKEHLENGYTCPACGEDAVEGAEVEINGKEASQVVTCAACEAEWVDVYVLTHTLEIKENE